jgi:hypothetical protein
LKALGTNNAGRAGCACFTSGTCGGACRARGTRFAYQTAEVDDLPNTTIRGRNVIRATNIILLIHVIEQAIRLNKDELPVHR